MSWSGGRFWLRLAAVTVLVGAGAWTGFEAGRWHHFLLETPYQGYLEPAVEIRLERGATAQEIATVLEARGVIAEGGIFLRYLRWHHLEERLKAGSYRFDRPLTLPQVARILAAGLESTVPVTIPEGWPASRIFALLEERGFGTHAAFMELWAEPERLGGLAPAAPSLEGYLFPDTYLLHPGMAAPEIVTLMIGRFRKQALSRLDATGRLKPGTLHAVVTLASLVEKETGAGAERPLVASVLSNRLARGMLLQCDPTVIYAEWYHRGEWDGAIHQSDLRRDSPWNTYVRPGLPPGPICSPGLPALEAALSPARTDYLYFVSRNDGTHQFSRDLRSHQQAVRTYQRRK